MIWKWANRKDDHFPTFSHPETRVSALESFLSALSHDLRDYLVEVRTGDEASVETAATRLDDTLRTIIKSYEDGLIHGR